jgi:putative methyltransferase (TIGR04325 family)
MKFTGPNSPRRRFKRFLQRLFPTVVNLVKSALSEMEYVPQGWYHIEGWYDPNLAAAQERNWPILMRNLEGPGPLGISHVPWQTSRENRVDHNIMMSYGYVLALAARKKDSLSMLDWGCGAGHYYLYTKTLLPDVAIDYHGYDVPGLCRLGRTLLPEAQLHDDERDVFGREYDLVVSSCSLHYFEHWREVMRKLAASTRDFLYVSRLNTVNLAPSFAALHSPFRDGYTEYLCWFINCQELLNCARECGLELVREFVFAEQKIIRGAPENGDCRGFLFRRRAPQ